MIEGANRHDSKLLIPTLENYVLSIQQKNNHLCCDKAYDDHKLREYIENLKMVPHIKSRGEEIEEKQEGKSAKRWAVERTMSWINQYRKLKIRWEKKSSNYEALCHFAFAMMAFKQAEVFG